MSRRRVVREQIEDLYEDGMRYATEVFPCATGIGCVARDVGDLVYSMVVAVDIEHADGTPITPRMLAGLPGRARDRALELVAIRACMHAHDELDRALADRPAT